MENIGKKFGKLTVMGMEIKKSKKGKNYRHYSCNCDCGNQIVSQKQNLTSGRIKSCGCESPCRMDFKKLNEFEIHGDTVLVKITNSEDIMLLDIDDWEYFKNYTIYINYKGYALYTDEKEKSQKRVHREIMGSPKNKVVDHINRNILDNRKSNLRICSNLENAKNAGISKANTSGYKGVYKTKQDDKWHSAIFCNGKKISLGSFTNIEDAAKAREEAEIKYYGEFARQEIINKGNYKMNRNKFSTVSFDQYKKDCIRELITPEELRKEYDDIILPKRATDRSAGYDFSSPFGFVLKPQESILLPTGIHMELEKYKYLQLAPRSSLGFKYRLQFDNVNPIIDSDYFLALNEGHIMLKLSNCSFEKDNILTVKKGDRLCQGIISPFYLMDDDDLDYKQTRTGGIGSTGTGGING